jgi:hypothetical protein
MQNAFFSPKADGWPVSSNCFDVNVEIKNGYPKINLEYNFFEVHIMNTYKGDINS